MVKKFYYKALVGVCASYIMAVPFVLLWLIETMFFYMAKSFRFLANGYLDLLFKRNI